MRDVEFFKTRAFHVERVLARWKQVKRDKAVLVRLPLDNRALLQICECHFGARHNRDARIDHRNCQSRCFLCECGGHTAEKQSHSRNLSEYHLGLPPNCRFHHPKQLRELKTRYVNSLLSGSQIDGAPPCPEYGASQFSTILRTAEIHRKSEFQLAAVYHLSERKCEQEKA